MRRCAVRAPTAKLGEGVAVHALAFVGEDTEIGDGATLMPGVIVARNFSRSSARIASYSFSILMRLRRAESSASESRPAPVLLRISSRTTRSA